MQKIKHLFSKLCNVFGVKYVVQDVKEFKTYYTAIQKIRAYAASPVVDAWNAFVIENKVSEKSVRTQYQSRQVMIGLFMGILSLAIVLACIQGLSVMVIFFMGFCTLILFHHEFRCYQIRHRQFIHYRQFIRHMVQRPAELWFSALPPTWTLRVPEAQNSAQDSI